MLLVSVEVRRARVISHYCIYAPCPDFDLLSFLCLFHVCFVLSCKLLLQQKFVPKLFNQPDAHKCHMHCVLDWYRIPGLKIIFMPTRVAFGDIATFLHRLQHKYLITGWHEACRLNQIKPSWQTLKHLPSAIQMLLGMSLSCWLLDYTCS